jgi:hypothetical protein
VERRWESGDLRKMEFSGIRKKWAGIFGAQVCWAKQRNNLKGKSQPIFRVTCTLAKIYSLIVGGYGLTSSTYR